MCTELKSANRGSVGARVTEERERQGVPRVWGETYNSQIIMHVLSSVCVESHDEYSAPH